MSNAPVILSGNSNKALAKDIARYAALGTHQLGEATISRFEDGESRVEIRENVRGRQVFVIQSTCTPVNDNLMDLLIICDALKRASAADITAVIPYFGYARQDRKVEARAPITAKLVMDMLKAAGASRVLTMDIHSGQEQGFFDGPVDNLYAHPIFLPNMKLLVQGGAKPVIVSPDAGGVARARAYAKMLGCPLAIIDKRREAANQSEVMNIIGEVAGLTAIIVDDMVDTAGTLEHAAVALKARGAVDVIAFATHAVLSGPALERIANSTALTRLVVTDTIPVHPAGRNLRASGRIHVLSSGWLFGDAVNRIHYGQSLSSLFG